MGKMCDSVYNLRTGSYDLLPLVAPETTGQEYLAEEDLVTILSGFYDRVSLLSDSLRTRMEAFDLLQYHKVERLG